MTVLNSIKDLEKHLSQLNNKSLGLVPTMGALHKGHLELIRRAKEENDNVVVTIFVNPKQFNNQTDFLKYPKTISQDLELLNGLADIVFCPSENEMYPNDFKQKQYDLGFLEETMEGAHRPGHFQGVCTILDQLFTFIRPTKAYFGQKDFQQVAVIKKLVKDFHPKIALIECATVRNESGLALSSRNLRLTEEEKKEALIIYKTMREAQKNFTEKTGFKNLIQHLKNRFDSSKLKLEYLEIVDRDSLKPLKDYSENAQICIAAYAGNVRLIDNLNLIY